MRQKHPDPEQLESYLLGRLDESTRLGLEASLRADPLAREELIFQSEVIAALRAYRKQELKERLRKLQAGCDSQTAMNTGG